MAKRRHRFSALHRDLKASNYTATSGRAGEYFNYLKGTNKLTIPRKLAGKYLKRFNVGVTPFGKEVKTGANDVNSCQGTITVAADNILKTVVTKITGVTDSTFGIERDLTKTKEETGFYPALCKVFVVTSGATKTDKTSQITKLAYKAINGRSGSIPYGRSIAVKEDGDGATVTSLSEASEEDSRLTLLDLLHGKAGGG